MTTVRRWIRLDVGWDDSEWLNPLSAGARLSWVMLLGHVKRDGVTGKAKAIPYTVAARRWRVLAEEVEEMVEAARKDGAIYEEDGNWIVTAWATYQVDYSNGRVKKHREEKRKGKV